VRAIVLERGAELLTPVTETLLMFAARSIHLDNLIRPALARGEWVVCDRFTDATRAYQAAGRGVSRAWIEELARAVHPDLAARLHACSWIFRWQRGLHARSSARAMRLPIASKRSRRSFSSACARRILIWPARAGTHPGD
jgi:hypothetical protein